jgi:hypothetical protein
MSRMPPSAQFQLVALARHLEDFLLGEARCFARQLFFQRLQLLDRVRNRLPVGEHAAKPAVVDEMLARGTCRIGNRTLRLALCADEQNFAALPATVADTKSSARANSGTVCERSRM